MTERLGCLEHYRAYWAPMVFGSRLPDCRYDLEWSIAKRLYIPNSNIYGWHRAATMGRVQHGHEAMYMEGLLKNLSGEGYAGCSDQLPRSSTAFDISDVIEFVVRLLRLDMYFAIALPHRESHFDEFTGGILV